MDLVEFLQSKFGALEGDETVVDYLDSVLNGLKDEQTLDRDDLFSLLPMFEQAVGEAFRVSLGLSLEEDLEGSKVKVDAFCMEIADLYGLHLGKNQSNGSDLDPIQQRQTSLRCASIEDFGDNGALLDLESKPKKEKNVPLLVDPSKAKNVTGSKLSKKSKKKNRKGAVAKTAGKEGEALSSKRASVKEEGKDWSTKRFERSHETWSGNQNWKLHDHALTLAVDELDDDDYSSAWLECLRKGIPWGGRGAGGRGIQRVTGEAKDIKIPNVSMVRGTNVLLDDATLLVVSGKRYGIVGRNGVGKTTLLRRIATGALPGFPPWVRVQYVEQELPGTDLTPVEYVLKFDFERTRLLLEEEEITGDDECDVDGTRVSEIYERLEQIDAFNAESRAEQTLQKLGFTKALLETQTKDLSGGWKMRVALAGAIFMEPDLLVLDEPTNHLDVLASEWLKRFLATKYDGTVLFVSHDRSFLNVVATDIIEFRDHKLFYFAGCYDEYRAFLDDQRKHVQRDAQAREKNVDKMRKFVEKQQQDARAGKEDAKKAKMIRSKIKRMHRHQEGTKSGVAFSYNQLKYSDLDAIKNAPKAYRTQASGVVQKVVAYDPGKPIAFSFHEIPLCRSEELIVLSEVDMGYPAENESKMDASRTPDESWKVVVSKVNCSVTSTSRVAIIGANGIGKSTLLKCMLRKIPAIRGEVKWHSSMTFGYYSQQEIEELDKTKTPVQLLVEKASLIPSYQGKFNALSARQWLGKFSLSASHQVQKIGTLSGGQKSRVVFALECLHKPNVMVLDEPTNHLDIESIEALGRAVKEFKGATVIVSHDIHFIASCCDELWILKQSTGPGRRQRSSEFAVHRDVEDFFEAFQKYLATQDVR